MNLIQKEVNFTRVDHTEKRGNKILIVCVLVHLKLQQCTFLYDYKSYNVEMYFKTSAFTTTLQRAGPRSAIGRAPDL